MDFLLRTAVSSGMGAIVDGESMDPAPALLALAENPHLICHSAFFIERLGIAAQAPRGTVRAAVTQTNPCGRGRAGSARAHAKMGLLLLQ